MGTLATPDLRHFLLPLGVYKRVSELVDQVLDLHIKYFRIPKGSHYQETGQNEQVRTGH